MRWLKRGRLQTSIILTSVILLLVLTTWIPVVMAHAQVGALGVETSITVTVQATPTEDATVTALNKEKLAQEVQQLRDQNEPDLLGWLRINAAILLSTLVVIIGGLIGLFRWFGDRRGEREKRAEERFQVAVTGLGDDKEGTRIGAAILLRTFLRPGYERFYTRTFDLVVANLHLPRTVSPQEVPENSLPLTPLSQALIVVFKEVFPLARSQNEKSPQSLDATGIQLDHAYMRRANLKDVWMPESFLRNADLIEANLVGADLSWVDLSHANLSRSNLSGCNLSWANLIGANLGEANLSTADLSGIDLSTAYLRGADLSDISQNKW